MKLGKIEKRGVGNRDDYGNVLEKRHGVVRSVMDICSKTRNRSAKKDSLKQQAKWSSTWNRGYNVVASQPRHPPLRVVLSYEHGERNVITCIEALCELDNVATCTSWFVRDRTHIQRDLEHLRHSDAKMLREVEQRLPMYATWSLPEHPFFVVLVHHRGEGVAR